MERLRFEFGGHPRESVLKRGETTVGRSEDAGLTVVTQGMSRNHFSVTCKDSGEWTVRDLGSSNGTRLNGQPVSGAAKPLHPGDVIEAGNIQFTFAAGPERSGNPRGYLVLLDESDQPVPGAKTVVQLSATLGRAEDNQVVTDDPQASSHHCAVEFRAGSFILRDLGSSNGTIYKGQRITEQALSDGDVFFLGVGLKVKFIAVQEQSQLERPTEHVAPAAPPPPPPIPMVGSLVTILIMVALGVALAIKIPEIGEKKDEADKSGGSAAPARNPAPEIAALGFEASGTLGGWTLAGDPGVTGGIDTEGPFDGGRALVLQMTNGPRRAVLTSVEVLPIKFASRGEIKIWLQGKASSATHIVVGIETLDHGRSMIGQADLSRVRLSEWSQLSIPCTSFHPVDGAKMIIEVTGEAAGLMMDGISLTPLAGAVELPTLSHRGVPFELQVDPQAPGMKFASGAAIRPLLVQEEGILRETTWLFTSAERIPAAGAQSAGEGTRYRWESLARDGVKAKVELELHPLSEPAAGYQCGWRLDCNDHMLALSVRPPNGELSLWDYAGNRVPVANPPREQVGTVSGLSTAGGGGFQVMVDNLKLSTQARVLGNSESSREVVLNFPRLNRGDTVRTQVYSAPVLEFWQLIAVLNEADLLAPPDESILTRKFGSYLGSAALMRVEAVLAAPATASFPALRSRALERKAQLESRADELFLKLSTHADKARKAEAGSPALRDESQAAMSSANQLMSEFPGDSRFTEAGLVLDEMRGMFARGSAVAPSGEVGSGNVPELDSAPIRSRRPDRPTDPELQAKAAAFAEKLMAEARTAFRNGNWLTAWVMADNVAHNFYFTASATDANTLATTIQEAWEDQEARDLWMESRLPQLQPAAVVADPKTAVRVAKELLARYPFSPQAPLAREALRAAGE